MRTARGQEVGAGTPYARSMARILLVEDDPGVVTSLSRRLQFEGFEVDTASDGAEALSRVAHGVPDVMVLDVMLPDADGFQVAEQVRRGSDVPILMLTARDTVQDRVRGLESGADDYLMKPFAIEELVARIRALLRRHRPSEAVAERLVFEDVHINTGTHEAWRGGEPLTLTPREFALLEYLIRHPRQVVSRDRLFEQVWGYDHEGTSNLVEVYVKTLRAKLEAGNRPRLLQTIRGIGYVLRP